MNHCQNWKVSPSFFDSSLHELKVNSHIVAKFLSSGLNSLKLDIEWIVLVVLNPEKERKYHYNCFILY
jgi:hypothetical protein